MGREVVISWPLWGWVLLSIAPHIAAKLIQQGGVNYARGRGWQAMTLAGALLLVFISISVLLAVALGIMETDNE